MNSELNTEMSSKSDYLNDTMDILMAMYLIFNRINKDENVMQEKDFKLEIENLLSKINDNQNFSSSYPEDIKMLEKLLENIKAREEIIKLQENQTKLLKLLQKREDELNKPSSSVGK